MGAKEDDAIGEHCVEGCQPISSRADQTHVDDGESTRTQLQGAQALIAGSALGQTDSIVLHVSPSTLAFTVSSIMLGPHAKSTGSRGGLRTGHGS